MYNYSSLSKHVTENAQQYLDDYGTLDCWQWLDEGLAWAIQDYYGCRGEFTDDDIEFLKACGFTPEDFTKEE